MKGTVMMAAAVVIAMAMSGCELVESGRTRAEVIGDIAQDNAQTAAVMREAFRRGTFDDALAAVMEDTLVAEEVFSVVHGHPLLADGEVLTSGKQMTPAELLKMLTSPAKRRAFAASRARTPAPPVISRAPAEQVLDETIRAYTRLERETVDPTTGAGNTAPLPTDPVDRTWESNDPPRSTDRAPGGEITTAPMRSDTSQGSSAVLRRNERSEGR